MEYQRIFTRSKTLKLSLRGWNTTERNSKRGAGTEKCDDCVERETSEE